MDASNLHRSRSLTLNIELSPYSLNVILGADRGPRLLNIWLLFNRQTHN